MVPDVRALREHLNQVQGLPPRFRQRLLLLGQFFRDTATLRSGMELELVVLAFTPNPSHDAVQEFTAAAHAGDFDKVRVLSDVNFPRGPRVRTRTHAPHSQQNTACCVKG